jgi:uncharacterized protein YjiS (DUF1127 family)
VLISHLRSTGAIQARCPDQDAPRAARARPPDRRPGPANRTLPNMHPRITETELALLLPTGASPETERARGLLLAALRLRDAFEATGLPRVLARVGGRLAEWNLRRRTVAELEALTDRDLADIGLTRGDIDRLAEGADAAEPGAPGRGRPAALRPAPRGGVATAAAG